MIKNMFSTLWINGSPRWGYSTGAGFLQTDRPAGAGLVSYVDEAGRPNGIVTETQRSIGALPTVAIW